MTGEPERIKELTAWLESDDAKNRAARVQRLGDLLAILPVPSDGLSVQGGEASLLCYEEVRRCYLDGSDKAVVLLSLAYVERELAAGLYAVGWGPAKRAPLGAVLQEAHQHGVLSERDWRMYQDLAGLRNSHAHFREPGSAESMMARMVGEDALPREVLARDAEQALEAMAGIMRRRYGERITLGPRKESMEGNSTDSDESLAATAVGDGDG